MNFSRKHLYISIVAFAVIFFAARYPFYNQRLVDEEGIFAYLFMNDVAKPYYHLMSRIDGVDIMGLGGHPSIMYASIELAGKFFRPIVDLHKYDAETGSFILRVIFSIPMLSVFIAGLIYIYKKKNASLYYWLSLFAAMAVSPVLLLTSTELQVDASFGVLTFGVWAIGVLCISGTTVVDWKIKGVIFSVLTILASLGKNEWSLVLFGSLVIAGLYTVVYQHNVRSHREALYILLAGVLGVIVGNVLSYMFDPANFMAGYSLMVSMSGNETLNHARFDKWIGYTRNRWTYISYIFLVLLAGWQLISKSMFNTRTIEKLLILTMPLLGFTFLSLWGEYPEWSVTMFLGPLSVIVSMLCFISKAIKNQKAPLFLDPVALVVPIFATILFAAFFLSTWNATPRYFALPIIVSALSLVIIFPEDNKLEKKIIGTMALCIVLLNAVSFLNFDSYRRLVPHKESFLDTECLPILSSGEAVFRKDDFLGASMNRDYFMMISQKYNKPLCQ